MITTTYNNEKVPELTFDDVTQAIKSVGKLKQKAIKRLDVGSEIFKSIKKLPKPDFKSSLFVGNLYGIEIRVDKTLKPNQYRIVK